jgi:hypothetical protein
MIFKVLTAVMMMMMMFYVVTLCRLMAEGTDSNFLQKTGIYLRVYMVSQHD